MSEGDIVKIGVGVLRGAIGTIEAEDHWGHFVRLWGDERPGVRYFAKGDLEVLQPAANVPKVPA